MTNETGWDRGKENFRRLNYFYENKINVHFKDFNDIFYNGAILNLDEKKLILILRERMRGEIPILLEDINPDSIRKFEEDKRK